MDHKPTESMETISRDLLIKLDELTAGGDMPGPRESMVIIKSLKKHFPARVLEWFASVQMLLWGTYLVLYPSMMRDEAVKLLYAHMQAMWDQPTWALGALFVAFVRLSALFINGAYTRTPLIRVVTSFLSAFIWAQALVGMSHVHNLSLIFYITALAADVYSAYRAGIDTVFAEKQRRIDREQAEIGRGLDKR